MKNIKLCAVVAAAILFFTGFASRPSWANSVTGGSGVTVGCNSEASCGHAEIITGSVFGSTTFSLSDPLTLSVLTSTTSAKMLAGDDLTRGSGEALDFDFTFGFPGGSSFTLSDFANTTNPSGDNDFMISGNVLSVTPTTGQWVVSVQPTKATIDPTDCACNLITVPVSGVTATFKITFDPGNVTGVTGGLSGGPFGGATPEPGTLLLLGSGLLGIAPFVRRKLGAA